MKLLFPLLLLLISHVSLSIDVEHELLVEACCCPKSQVDATFQEMLSILERLVKRPYFRFYRANLEKECPYWAVELMCGMSADGGPAPCNVCTCDEHEVPIALRHEAVCGDLAQSRGDGQEENKVPIDVDRTLPWTIKTWDDDPSAWCSSEDYDDPDAVYIDLVRNPEANTGYVGEGARRVWSAIYQENCFQGDFKKMCTPERAFFRLLSGLHVSISVHIATNFYRKNDAPLGGQADIEQWDPNLGMFMRTVGNWPDRIDNLYFLYMFVLRALNKAKPVLSQIQSFTGDESDELTKQDIEDLLRARLVCTPTFNETLMFQGIENKESIHRQMRSHFFNISRLMDCLSCEKCRLWGKLQTQGLGVALRLVIDDVPCLMMTRSEVVALINLLRQLSTSLDSVKRLLHLWEEQGGATQAFDSSKLLS